MSRKPFLADRREAIALTAGAAMLPLIGEGTALAATGPATAIMTEGALGVGRDQPFDNGWRFRRGAGDALEQPALDDSGWRSVDLPHDWSIEDLPGNATGPFIKSSKGATSTGFTEGGEGWYRKHFSAAALPADAHIEVLFDGVYVESDVWINGQKLGSNVHGYMPFAFDLTPHINRSGDNVLAVHVRNLGRNSRWYAGSGLYRQVKIDVLPASARIARWGVAASTRKIEGGVAEITTTTQLVGANTTGEVITRLRDAKGKIAAQTRSDTAAGGSQLLSVRTPQLWSPENPYLYTLETELLQNGIVIDRMTQPFGVRIVTMDPQRGLAINGTVTKLRGGCIHHDNGLLGACAFAQADDRRVRLLKARGYNAIRSSHNPASRTLRDACDRLGMLLIEEAFDVWVSAKEPQDFSTQFRGHWEEVLRTMVHSARNSPSVIMWSIGNEIPDRATDEGIEWEWKLANAVRQLDPTRPVTAALHGMLGAPVVASAATARPGRGGKVDNASSVFLDVLGYNYRLDDIEGERSEHPERVVYASETFPKDCFDYAALMDRAPYFIGEFVWTAMDYLGEAGIGGVTYIKPGSFPLTFGAWPWVNAWCGDIDLIGDQKAPSRARDVAWGVSKLELMVQRPVPEGKAENVPGWGWSDELPSWSWDGQQGKMMNVRFYTPGNRVELMLNGVKIGEKALTAADKKRGELQVPYAPGTLEAVAYSGSKVIARRKLVTVGAAAKLRIRPEHAQSGSGRQNLSYLAIDVLDAQGRLLPDDKRKLTLTIEGGAKLAAFGSANPLAIGSFQSNTAESFRGRALAILRSQGGKGSVRVTVQADGLQSASTMVKLV
jgi:beta-galactosidase